MKDSKHSKVSTSLHQELAQLDPSFRARLPGFDADRLVKHAEALRAHGEAIHAHNRVGGDVRPPSPDDVPPAPDPASPRGQELARVGNEAIARGELAFCVMAGGMATRMGGVVKALVEAFDGRTFLSLRLGENATWTSRSGRPVPLWLMTSEATDGPIREALRDAGAPPHVATFTQDVGLRLTPAGHLFRGADGAPSTYATGHGDLVDALRRSGLLDRFLAAGGKYVWITNLDNLGASIDPLLLGYFIETGKPVMVEVAPKVAGDRGGVPVWARSGKSGEERLQVLEEFRMPEGFDASQVPVFNTNTFLARADSLATADIGWSWCVVHKKVEGRTAVQFERLLQELSATLPSAYVTVPRDGERSRFLPVKDHEELERRRADIVRIARLRGMV